MDWPISWQQDKFHLLAAAARRRHKNPEHWLAILPCRSVAQSGRRLQRWETNREHKREKLTRERIQRCEEQSYWRSFWWRGEACWGFHDVCQILCTSKLVYKSECMYIMHTDVDFVFLRGGGGGGGERGSSHTRTSGVTFATRRPDKGKRQKQQKMSSSAHFFS